MINQTKQILIFNFRKSHQKLFQLLAGRLPHLLYLSPANIEIKFEMVPDMENPENQAENEFNNFA